MCGISGIVGPGAESEGALLKRMSDRIAHRGPDDSGAWTAPGVALAHRRLSIIDLSALGHQPMQSDCGRYTITFNGEIYNYVELRHELEQSGERFRSGSDTEVLIAAFRRWGAACLSKLNGMWAFAIWDATDRVLFASRDRFGKKPFYYAETSDRLLFASEVKSILADPRIETAPSATAVADFCAERVSDHTAETFFQGVRQLPAGHYLWWRPGALVIEQYWSLPVRELGAYDPSDAEEIRALLQSAIQIRLRADTPVGALLSGGLDSSTLTCMANQVRDDAGALQLFSTVYDPPYEEAEGIAAVRARFPDSMAHFDQPGAEDFWADLPAALWHQEQPFGDASMVAHFRLMRVARDASVPVLLSGQAADEVFAGYPGYLWIYLGSRLRAEGPDAFLRAWREIAAHQPVAIRNVLLNLAPAWAARLAKRSLAGSSVTWLAPEYRQVSPAIFHDSPSRGADPLDQALEQAVTTRTLPGFLHYEDRNSMAFGVETRLPFLDYRLVERLFSLSPGDKLRGGVTKSLLRSASEGFTPDPIRLRTRKMGYPAPLLQWLRAKPAALQDAVARADQCPLLEGAAWKACVGRFFAGDDHAIDSVWRGYILAEWYRMFFGEAARA